MANGILAQAILSQRAPDIVGQFEAGRQAATQQQAVEQQQLAQQQLGALLGQQLPQQFQALAQSDPSLALQAAQATGAPIGGRARQAELARSLQIINQVGSVDQNAAFNLAQREVDLLRSQGVDTSNLQAEIEQGRQNPEAFFKGVGARVQAFQQAGILERPDAGKPFQFGGQETFKDSAGNLFFGTTKRNPATGDVQTSLAPVGGGPESPVGQVSLVSGIGETAAEKAQNKIDTAKGVAQAQADVKLETEGQIEGTKAAAKQAITKSGEAFDKLEKLIPAQANIAEAIDLIDQGAKTGVIMSKLPSIRSASQQLDNLQGRLGLDVIGNTTFGALSESELKFALDTALPKNLKGPELRKWLVRKQDAQSKLSDYLTGVATYLGTPGNTVADWLELQKLNRMDAEAPTVDAAASEQTTVSPSGQVTQTTEAAVAPVRFVFNPATGKLEPKQ